VSAFDATPTAFLYGYVDTDAPGYRQVSLGGSVKTVAAGYYRWDAFITAINAAITSAGWAIVSTSTGLTTLTKASGTAAVVWPDRMGWLLGYDQPPNAAEGTVAAVQGRTVAPGAIPLIGATWDSVEIQKERQFVVDRSQRGHGYVFGTSRVWRWRLVMSEHALEALRSGWCLSGKVVVSAKDPTQLGADSPWSTSNTDGYVEGVPVGVEGVRWLDTLQTVAEVTLLITTAGP
tara:strand:+ start:776 stop:1474 length:699 start_codon:yes stop_codon:yes gene_type:complete